MKLKKDIIQDFLVIMLGINLLLFQLTSGQFFNRNGYGVGKTNIRKFYFFNEEGRGLFDDINDVYEKIIKTDKKILKYFSSSIILGLNETEKNRYFISIELTNFFTEFLDIKTGEFTFDILFELSDIIEFSHGNYLLSWIQILKLP